MNGHENSAKNRLKGVESFPIYLMLLYVLLVAIISQTKIEVTAEQIDLVQTIALGFIAINISLLLFNLPSLASKRDKKKELLEQQKPKSEVAAQKEEIRSISEIINSIIIQTICSFLLFLVTSFVAIFVKAATVKFAFLISSLIIQSSYFLNMLMWIFFVYYSGADKKLSEQSPAFQNRKKHKNM